MTDSDFTGPVNVGSKEMVTINRLAELIKQIAGKKLTIRHVPGPLGVRGRNSDNRLIQEKLGWQPGQPLRNGLENVRMGGEASPAGGEQPASLRELSRNLREPSTPVFETELEDAVTRSSQRHGSAVPIFRKLAYFIR